MKKVLIGILIGLIVGVGSMFIYNEFFVKKDNTTKTDKNEETKKEEIKEETLDINSDLVQELANNLLIGGEAGGCTKLSIVEDVIEKTKINATEFTQEFKNYLGYRQLPNSQVESAMCRDYPSVLYSKTKHLCGNAADYVEYNFETGSYDDTDSMTKIIQENNLKKSVEKIFGTNSYNKVTLFGISELLNHNEFDKDYEGFLYDQASQSYVYFIDPAGGTCGGDMNFKIESATKTNNSIVIVEKVNREQDEYNEKIDTKLKYIFKLSKDGNYYFESVEKIN